MISCNYNEEKKSPCEGFRIHKVVGKRITFLLFQCLIFQRPSVQQVCTEINLSLYMCENNLSFETLSASHQSRKFEMLFMNKYISRRMRHREKKTKWGCENYSHLDIFMYRIRSFLYFFLIIFVEIVTSEKCKFFGEQITSCLPGELITSASVNNMDVKTYTIDHILMKS